MRKSIQQNFLEYEAYAPPNKWRRKVPGLLGGFFELRKNGVYYDFDFLKTNLLKNHPIFLQYTPDEVKNFFKKYFKCVDCGRNLKPEFEICRCKSPDVLEMGLYIAPLEVWDICKALCSKYRPQTEAQRKRNQIRQERLKNIQGHHSDSDLRFLWKQQKGRCYYCQKKFGKNYVRSLFEVDHIKRVSAGGSNWPKNLRLACRFCNASRK